MNKNIGRALQSFLVDWTKKNPAFTHLNNFYQSPPGERDIEDMVARAKRLSFFEPFNVIQVQLGDPDPDVGLASHAFTFVFTVQSTRIEQITLRWMHAYRQEHPLKLTQMPLEEIKRYIEELHMLSPQSYDWGVRVSTLNKKEGLTYRFVKEHEGGSMGSIIRESFITFDPQGGIVRSEIPYTQ